MRELDDLKFNCTRRHFLSSASLGIGSAALGVAARSGHARRRRRAGRRPRRRRPGRCSRRRTSCPRVKRVIYLFQSGGPSQLDLFDYKPLLRTMNGEELPASVRMGQRLTGMTAPEVASRSPARSSVRAARPGGHGSASCCRTPPRIVDELCFVQVDAHRGDQPRPGDHLLPDRLAAGRPAVDGRVAVLRPRLRERRTCPAFIVLLSRAREGDQPLYSRLWGSGFLPSQHQGVQFRRGKTRCSTSATRRASTATSRRRMLDTLRALEQQQHARVDDPEIDARIAQYEMAYRMQTACPR